MDETNLQQLIIEKLLQWPELVTDNKFETSIDCITGQHIPIGTRIVTTTAKTKNICKVNRSNLTMTVETYKSIYPTSYHNTLRNGQSLWDVDQRNQENVINNLNRRYKNTYSSDISDILKLLN